MRSNEPSALPRAGEPDPSFRIEVPSFDGEYLPLSLQLPLPDGSFILGCYRGTTSRTCLVRVLRDNTLDTDFGENGYAFIEFTDEDLFINSMDDVYLLPNSEFLVRLEVRRRNAVRDFVFPALAKFTSTGKKDLTFGNGGSRAYDELDPPPVTSEETGPCPEPTGDATVRSNKFWFNAYGDLHRVEHLGEVKLLLLGNVYYFPSKLSHKPYVLRLNTNGEYDTSFNGKGYMEPGSGQFRPRRMLPDGNKFLISSGSAGNPGIRRYNEDGSYDPTFGYEGSFIDTGELGYTSFYRMLLTNAGNIVCVGQSPYEPGPSERNTLCICMINKNGERVGDFNGGKTVYLESPTESLSAALHGFDAMLDEQECVVLCGRQLDDYANDNRNAFLARVLADGTPDTELGSNGVLLYRELRSLDRLSKAPGGNYYAITLIMEYFLGRYFG